MNNNTKKTLLIIALVVIAALLIVLVVTTLNKGDLGTKRNNNKPNTTTNVEETDPVKMNKITSALGYIDAVQQQVIINKEDANIPEIKEGTYELDSLKLLNVDFKGENPNTAVVTINGEGIVTNGWFEFAENKVYFDGENTKIVNEFPDKTTANCVVTNDNGAITNSCN